MYVVSADINNKYQIRVIDKKGFIKIQRTNSSSCTPDREQYIENYIQTLDNLGKEDQE